jgi:hypothetical protein
VRQPDQKATQRRRDGPEVHGCPGSTEGLARVIKSVTFTGGRWGLSLPASSMSFYKHGSVSADIAAAKSAGERGSQPPSAPRDPPSEAVDYRRDASV